MESILRFLYQLVSLDTSHGEDAGIYFLEKEFEKIGVDNIYLQYIDDKALNLIINEQHSPELLIATHIDTIPPRAKIGIKDNYFVTGTGAVDAKASIASIYAMLKETKNLPENISIAIFSGEETTSSGCYKYLENHNPKRVLVMEPSDLSLSFGSYGYVEFELVASGYSRHPDLAAYFEDYEEKEDAVRRILKFIAEMENFAKGKKLRFTITNLIAKGNIYSTPDSARLTINVILPHGLEIFDIINATLGLAERNNIEAIVTDYWEPFETRDEEFKTVLKQAYREALSVDPDHSFYFGWTDASLFAKRKIPSAIFGPGKPELAHTVDEAVDIRDVLNASRFLEKLIEKFS